MSNSISPTKVRENRVRRMAERQGLQLHRSRRRDPRAYDYGTYWLTDPNTNSLVYGGDDSTGGHKHLTDIEVYLTPENHCSRCGRPSPSMESPAYVYWEATGSDEVGLVCPSCITPEEETAMAEDMAAIAEDIAAARKGHQR